jgi:hypothetical protein
MSTSCEYEGGSRLRPHYVTFGLRLDNRLWIVMDLDHTPAVAEHAKALAFVFFLLPREHVVAYSASRCSTKLGAYRILYWVPKIVAGEHSSGMR